MRESEAVFDWRGRAACRVVTDALRCVAGLALVFALGAVGVRAQGDGARKGSIVEREAAMSAQRRARRVAAVDSSKKKESGGAKAEGGAKAKDAAVTATEETTTEEVATEKATTEKGATAVAPQASASETEIEDGPPAPADEGSAKGDRLGRLRAQIENAKGEMERARLQRTLVDYLVALDRRKEAIEELRLMARGERFDPVGFYNIGNALARMGDTEAAIEAYRKAVEQRRGHYARALNNLGVVLLRQGRWDEAEAALKAALTQEAYRYPEASYNLGRLYSLRGEAALAMREWNRALAQQPDHADAVLALARAYSEDGNPQKAVALIDAFLARRGVNKDLVAARREIMYGAEWDEAATPVAKPASPANAETKPASPSQPANAAGGSPVNVKTGASRSSGNGSGAGAKPSSGAATNNGASDAKAKAAEKNSRGSAPAALRPLAVDRETYDLLERARAAREAGKDLEAVSFYNRVLGRRGGFFPPANLEISFVLAGLDRHAEAIASLQQLVSREGERYPIAYFHLGRQYEALGQFGSAAEAYGRAAAAYGEREPQFLLDLSRVRQKEGNLSAALAALEEYARLGERSGRTTSWVTERIAELRRQQNAATAETPAARKP
jgi:tetratricopeptide (TPR) repeat protein